MFIPKVYDKMEELMGVNVLSKLKTCGKSVMIYPLAKIVNPHLVEIGDHSRLVDFSFIHGGRGTKIGRYVDFQQFASIWSNGETLIGDFVSIGPGVVISSAYYRYKEGAFMTGVVPPEFAEINFGKVVIGDHAHIGANCTITFNVNIGEGAVVGANSVVTKDCDPWGIYVGSPLRKIGNRPKSVLNLVPKLDKWAAEHNY